MFITTLNIPFIGVTERLLLFSLSGLACDVFHRHALPCVYHYALRQGRYLRHIQNTDKVITGLRVEIFSVLRLRQKKYYPSLYGY